MHTGRISVVLLAAIVTVAPAFADQQAPATPADPVAQPEGSVTIADLFSDRKEALIGSPITLRSVQVRDKTNRQALWVGANSNQTVLVTMPATVRPVYPDGSRADLQKGDLINVTGVVQRAPLAHLLHYGWGVDQRDAALVESSGIIINGMKVEVADAR